MKKTGSGTALASFCDRAPSQLSGRCGITMMSPEPYPMGEADPALEKLPMGARCSPETIDRLIFRIESRTSSGAKGLPRRPQFPASLSCRHQSLSLEQHLRRRS